MSSLFGTLSIAVGALQAEQGALSATTNNVANANTPGYSRHASPGGERSGRLGSLSLARA